MRKILLLVLGVAVTIMSCGQNYDDQFNDLNDQISALSTQVTGLSKVQTDLSTLAGTVNSLQTSINNSGSTLSTALASLQEQINALKTKLDAVASSEDLTNVNNSLEGVKEDLEDLLTSANVFNGDLNVNSVATLEFAESLKGKVAIINGNVIIELNTDMDADAIQKIASQIKTITKDLTVRAKNSSVSGIKFDSLTGVNNLKIAQAGFIAFPRLKSAADITIGNNYESKLTGDVDFGALSQVKSFKTTLIGTTFADAAGGDTEENTIALGKMSTLNLGSLGYYTPKKLTINGDQDTTLNLSSLKSVDANGKDKSYTITVDGAGELNIPGLVLGTVKVDNVKTVTLEAFSGTFTLGDGVENVSIGNLKKGFSAKEKKDLETLSLVMDAASKGIDLTDAEGLKSASISGKVKSITLNNNSDLTTLEIDAAIESLTVSDTNLSEAHLKFTNANLAEKGTLMITGNDDLTNFSANNVDGLAKLIITGNKDLETISFDALKAVPTKAGVNPKVEIGGTDTGKGNSLSASNIVQESKGSKDGDFTTDSGLDDLKTYLTAAAKNAGASLKIYFDTADDFTDGDKDDSNLKISVTDDQSKLVVINRDGSSDATKAKRAFLVNAIANGTLAVNGTSISWGAGSTNADFVSNLLSTSGNVAKLKNNGVTLTANSNGNPKATATTAERLAGPVGGVGQATKKADADKVTLTIGDYSTTIYLSTAEITDLIEDDIAGTDKSAETAFLATNGTTTVQHILTRLQQEFGTAVGTGGVNTSSPYSVTVSTTASGTLNIVAKDRSNAHHEKAIKFTASTDITGFTPKINSPAPTGDDEMIGKDPVIIIESIRAGKTLSNIGNPRTSYEANPGDATAGDAGGGGVGSALLSVTPLAGGRAVELHNNTAVKDKDESTSVTNHGKDSTTGSSNVNRLSWLAG